MNYQLAPFTYITRNTGVRAVLKSAKVMPIPTGDGNTYKSDSGPSYRLNLNLDDRNGTLKGFQNRFDDGDIFHSASEICNIYLVPTGQTYGNMASYWNNFGLTGDNTREVPYGQIYPRFTTKSNTYQIHVIAQTLRQISAGRGANDASAWGTWNENKDQVISEYRGATVIERYIDPNDPNLPDFAGNKDKDGKTLPANDNKLSIDNYYKFRIVSMKKL